MANEAETKELREKTRAFEVEAERLQTQLARLEVHVRTVAQKEQQVTQLGGELDRRSKEVTRLRAVLETQQFELESIYANVGWKIVSRYRRMKDRLFLLVLGEESFTTECY